MSNTSKIIAAFAVGAAVGAALGILFAPDKGSETRKKMSEEGKKMADKMKDVFREAKEKFDTVAKDVKNGNEEYI
jgi:gas vesicle protein